MVSGILIMVIVVLFLRINLTKHFTSIAPTEEEVENGTLSVMAILGTLVMMVMFGLLVLPCV